MELKYQIKIARQSLGLDQETLAFMMGVSKQAVIFWEKGKGPKLNRIKDLERVLKTKFDVSSNNKNEGFDKSIKSKHLDLTVKLAKLSEVQFDAISILVDMALNPPKQVKPIIQIERGQTVEEFIKSHAETKLGESKNEQEENRGNKKK